LEVSAIFKSYVLSLLHSTACSSLSPRITRLQEHGGENTRSHLHFNSSQILWLLEFKIKLVAVSGLCKTRMDPTEQTLGPSERYWVSSASPKIWMRLKALAK
jgi:hypothetical protein